MIQGLKTVTLLARTYRQGFEPGMAEALLLIATWLKEQGLQVVLEEKTAQHLPDWLGRIQHQDIPHACQLVIVLGGDGTTIGIARELMGSGVPIVGINFGRVGFITDIAYSHWQAWLTQILNGDYSADQRTLIEGRVMRNNQEHYRASALNDIVLSRGGGTAMLEWRVEVDGAFMVEARGDGLIVATPTGSTAYSLSLGGPILHPHLPGLVLTAIAPHALANRPIIVPTDAKIAITVASSIPCNVSFDMQMYSELQQNDVIEIEAAKAHTVFWHPKDWNYYETLRQKLYWHSPPSRV